MKRTLLLPVLLLISLVTWSHPATGSDLVTKTKIKLGTVLGKVEEFNGKRYASFRGIRFARPPVGKLRLLPPEPLEEAWNDDLVFVHNNLFIYLESKH